MPLRSTESEPAGPRQRVLWLSTIAFTVMFAVWLMLGVLGLEMKKDTALMLGDAAASDVGRRDQDRRTRPVRMAARRGHSVGFAVAAELRHLGRQVRRPEHDGLAPAPQRRPDVLAGARDQRIASC